MQQHQHVRLLKIGCDAVAILAASLLRRCHADPPVFMTLPDYHSRHSPISPGDLATPLQYLDVCGLTPVRSSLCVATWVGVRVRGIVRRNWTVFLTSTTNCFLHDRLVVFPSTDARNISPCVHHLQFYRAQRSRRAACLFQTKCLIWTLRKAVNSWEVPDHHRQILCLFIVLYICSPHRGEE